MEIFSVGQKVLINEEHNRRSIEGTVIAIPKKNTIVYDNDIIGNPDFMIEWTPDYCDNAENECSINKKEKHTIKYNNQLKYFVRMDNGLINLVFDEYIIKERLSAFKSISSYLYIILISYILGFGVLRIWFKMIGVCALSVLRADKSSMSFRR